MTVEAAFAVATLIVVVVLCISAILAVSMQIRCVDAAREAARLASRGDHSHAVLAAQRVAPSGAVIQVKVEDDEVVVSVESTHSFLPLVHIRAQAVAMREPGLADE